MAVTTAPPSLTRSVDSTAPDVIEVAVPRKPVVHWERHYVTLAVVIDAAVAFGAGVLAFLLWPGSGPPPNLYVVLTALLPFAWPASVALAGGYQRAFLTVGPEEFNRVGIAALGLVTFTGTTAWVAGVPVDRTYVAISLLGSAAGTALGRYGLRKHVHRQRRSGHYQRRTILVGSASSVDDLAGHLDRYRYHGYGVLGACVTGAEGSDGDLGGARVANLGRVSSIADIVRTTRADTVAVTADSGLDSAQMRQLSWQLEPLGTTLFVAPSLMEIAGPRLSVHPVEGVSLLHVEQPSLAGAKRLVKETGDTLLSAIGLLALLPVMLAIGILVRWDSPGPALFRQTRIGRYGKPFRIVKFRTMVIDAEDRLDEVAHLNESEGPLFKAADDPRVTRLGAFLRRTSLDELPQLWNVLLGEMSLVGPRPHLPDEVAHFGPLLRRRLIAKPGMTGLWQISGRSDLDWDETVRADLRYVENWSLGLDVMILWKTIAVVAKREGAY